jgi:carboxypeptidase C (cathepsin A)
MTTRHALIAGCFTALLSLPLLAQGRPAQTERKDPDEHKEAAAGMAEKKEKEPPKDNISTTQHAVSVGGQSIAYTARAGTIVMKDEDGAAKANFFFVSYTRDGTDPSKRPVTFAFNGGPGSSSVWLHMGALGPRRVAYRDDEGHAAQPPYHLVDNEDSILDATDLVFIDPVTTGYSRAIPVKEDASYHSVEGDVKSVAAFIRLWTTRYARWASPKFLAGESYGTTRAAGLSGALQAQGMYLNGIILVSSILNFQTARFDSGNDLPYILFLPTYTATAWYHRRLAPDLQASLEKAVAESESFALGEYSAALMKGAAIGEQERKSIVEKLARLTGLSAGYVERTNLRIRIDRFDKELLRDQRRTTGRLDSRFTGIDADAAGERPEYDPANAAITGEYAALFNDYVRRELRFESDLPYEVLTDRVRPWSFDKTENHYLDVGETLRSAMNQNPFLKVFVANGYYDLATPFAATRYTFSRMALEPEIRKNLSMDYFEAGHMMYIDRRAHARLKKDLAEFIQAATGH